MTLLKGVGVAVCTMLGLAGPELTEQAAAAERHPERAAGRTSANFFRVTQTLFRSAQLSGRGRDDCLNRLAPPQKGRQVDRVA